MITDDFGRTVPIEAHVSAAHTLNRNENRILKNPMLEDVDEVYTAVIKALRENRSKADILRTSESLCREYIGVWE